MNTDDFDYITGLVKERSGIVISKEKVYLLESRLSPVARRRGLADIDALVKEVRQSREEALIDEVVEAMTTNESFFFRDKTPFDTFRDTVLPELLKIRAHRRQIRIWCAAASNGQEPYSLAMMLKEQEAKLKDWRIDILATDIAANVVERAKMGLYSQFEVQRGMPIQMLVKYFSEVGDMWQISPEIRSMVMFRPFNLLESYAVLGSFDVVFCRNVLIYFDQETKADVLHRLSQIMPAHGSLFLGAAETVLGICPRFKPVSDKRGLYVMADNGQASVA